MAEFHIYQNIYNEVNALSDEANELLNSIEALENTKITTGNIMAFSPVLLRLTQVVNDLKTEKSSFDGLTTAIMQIMEKYENAEKINSMGPYGVSNMSSKDYITDKDIDAFMSFLDKFIMVLLILSGRYPIYKDIYKKILKRFEEYLYEIIDVVIVIDTPRKKKTEEEIKKEEEEKKRQEEEQQRKEEEQRKAEEEKKRQEEEQRKAEEEKKRQEEERRKKEEAERKKKEEAERKKNDRTPDYSNKVFDNKGLYGARQRLDSTDKDLYAAMRQADPNLTDKQCAALIKRLGPEGCAYAGMTNIIMRAYEGRAEDFEAYFGFSMYKGGDLNYDALTAYIYARFDDPNVDGLTPGHMGDMLDIMVPEMGNNYHAEYFYEPDYNNIPNDCEHGVLAFCTQGSFTLESVSGKKTTYNEAHYMTVTGITGDGRLIVSSWGNKYYIDPSQYSNAYYTYFTFDTIA